MSEPRTWTSEYYRTNELACKSILENSDYLQQIPCLNSSSLDHLKHGHLVKFRGMVQDMYDPEYYFKKYSVKNKDTGESKIYSGMYKDSAQCLNNETEVIEMDSELNIMSERHTCVVISIPGLNDWAKEKGIPSLEDPRVPGGSISTKRELNDEEPMDICEPPRKKEKTKVEKQGTEEIQNSFLSKEHILNFPISNNDGKACIVKVINSCIKTQENVYDDKISLKLNEIVHILGFVSLDPTLGIIHSSDEMMSDPEIHTHNPPVSLVPRLHAIKITVETPLPNPRTSNIYSRVESIRSDLRMVLGQLLFGDVMAADYLICHLISSVYLRKDHLCLGSFPINITNFPIAKYKSFTKDLYEVIASLVPKSHYLEITLDQLNDLNFIPKKDYECNRLTSGILQLSKNTHLVIDETGLTSGRVSAIGKKNYEAMTDMIQFQKVNYDFKYFSMEYETDIPVLILSEVKSFIPCPTQIPLMVDEDTEDLYPRVMEAARQYLRDEERLSKIRDYLEVARIGEFEFGGDITDEIQEDFVKLRQSRKNFGADNLHSLMVLARLMSLSRGKNDLTMECWKETVNMELQRMDRLPQRKT
ncbi:mini-chromosome maintenance complex-binding protein isoform X2 [Venturia canescens]|uniref:mini-chromosome maintenance complex-binding protein isoform X2 n=1 Tax=Venturia canescens TaxID=32260 RepID=UPI001C9C52B2|nr:mini-chromosome maintenance complex-binding protein isoform X2 [Venturia canescens]